jgi:Spy/CpxP family protein refolding chaperone
MMTRGELVVGEPQRAELLRLMERCDEASARSDARATELARSLRALLRDPAADVATIRARARELGALRAAAVEGCVDAALALRALLTPAEAGRVLDACCGGSCCGE